METITSETILKSSDALKAALSTVFGGSWKPKFAIVGGSGLSVLEEIIQEPKFEVPYNQIGGFPVSTVPGHNGKLVFGSVGKSNTKIVLMSGRAHYYEGHDLQKVTFPIRILQAMGVAFLIATNAAGGLNAKYEVGDVVVMNDHLNFVGLAGTNPLRGQLPGGESRFVALSDAYDLGLRRTAHRVWKEMHGRDHGSSKPLHEGVYAFVGGPNYETRAECRMLSILGADMVGMSTVPEIIVGRHCGVRVLGISVITNNAVKDPTPRGDDPDLANIDLYDLRMKLEAGRADHEEVLRHIRIAAESVKQLIVGIIDGAEEK